jgi:hypothetical protein
MPPAELQVEVRLNISLSYISSIKRATLQVRHASLQVPVGEHAEPHRDTACSISIWRQRSSSILRRPYSEFFTLAMKLGHHTPNVFPLPNPSLADRLDIGAVGLPTVTRPRHLTGN